MLLFLLLLLMLLLVEFPGGCFALAAGETCFYLFASAALGAEFARVYGEEDLWTGVGGGVMR